MTPKEQARMKILLLVLFGIAIAVLAYTLLNDNSDKDKTPIVGTTTNELSQEEFEKNFQDHATEGVPELMRVETGSKKKEGVTAETFQNKLEQKVEGKTVKTIEVQQNEFLQEFNTYVSQ